MAAPRKGETGYRAPLSHADAVAVRSAALAAARGAIERAMAADARPTTVAGFRKRKRAELAQLRESLAIHRIRVATGDDVCQCRYHSAYVTKCEDCGKPGFYRGYSVDNARSAVRREEKEIAAKLAERRGRAKGYCSEVPNDASPYEYPTKYGKCYSRALSAFTSAHTAALAKCHPPIDRQAIRDVLSIFGTAHTATEVARAANGVTYFRGTMRHDRTVESGGRGARDHAPVKLADGVWYLAVRNTVPRG
jgi:hypothetical protein